MSMTPIKYEVTVGGRVITFEFQKFAKQANGSVMVSSGGTQVLVTVCASDSSSPDLDFFPLTVEYIEKSYAAGRVPGGYLKREGKPSNSAALTARLIDRPLRPCFPKNFRREVIVTATVMSYEHGFNPGPLALVGASTALMVSDIPFNGPVAGLSIGLKDGQYLVDPREGVEGGGDLDLHIACKPDAVLMVEASANFLSEAKMLESIEYAHKVMEPFFGMQIAVQKEIGKPKFTVEAQKDLSSDLLLSCENMAGPLFKKAFQIRDKQERSRAYKKVVEQTLQELSPGKGTPEEAVMKSKIGHIQSDLMRSMILDQGTRIDGRSLKDIRPITCEVGVLKRPHGSSLFTRGETQALASVTLAAAEDQQRSEALWDTDLKDRFMLHYNFPPFSVGEARSQRTPGRREIGHGSLARRALTPALPSEKEFGYTIRVVSETLESNGSSSMAAVCSGTMALLHASVPLKSPVAGIAMGLVKESDRYAVLSDILGDEDHLGDMDFKVCGNKQGISALQMDIKIEGLSTAIMAEALEQAKAGRFHILDKMEQTISAPHEISELAPRMFKLKINPDKIRDLIGPGGKTIKKITADTGVKMDVDDSGVISIVAADNLSAQAARSMIRSYTTAPQVGEVYLGRAVRIVDFGVFFELRPGLDGLCHISHLDEQRVERVEDVMKLGDEALVKVIDIDRQGRIKLSRKEAFGVKPSFS